MKPNRHLIIGLMVVVALLISGCAKELSPSIQSCIDEFKAKNIKLGDYVPSNVIVGFHENVTEEEAIKLFDSYGLKFKSNFPKMFSVFANYKPEIIGTEGYSIRKEIADAIVNKDKEINGKDFIVLWAEPRLGKILIQFNMLATENTAKELLNSFEGLEIESINYGSKGGSVIVPPGSEFEWICRLQENPDIEYAELNFIKTLD